MFWQTRPAEEVAGRSRIQERAQWASGAGDMEVNDDQPRVARRGGGIDVSV
ncbi:hypothetical protein PI125_g20804 [Phytophthora idaei]|nr:hypothetical protein PI125_g20804 [Phytophthora idaei]